MKRLAQKLSKYDVGQITANAPLRDYSWWKIGGPADLLIEPHTIDQLQCCIERLRQVGIPYIVMGAGSNLLFDDQGVRGAVIKIGSFLSRVSINHSTAIVQAGAFVPRLVRLLGKSGLSGLEHAIGIPGTFGGLIAMNGGSQRKNVGALISKATAIHPNGQLQDFDNDSCSFSYRNSIFLKNRAIIVDAEMKLTQENPQLLRTEMLTILRYRRTKFPLKQRSCGSVFLSDPQTYQQFGPPGEMIERCGYKGLRIGNAMIPYTHANFIINVGKASSSDVLTIIQRVRRGVLQNLGCELRCEAHYVSPDCIVIPAHRAKQIFTNNY
jgi:UDP-N-acetylmuramate dehydrogenase